MLPFAAALLVGFGVAQFATLLTTVYLHRALSHRALTLHPAVDFTIRVLLWVTTGIRRRQWVAVHRKHHAYTDIPGDPHSPKLEGFMAVQFNNVGLYRRVAKNPAAVRRYARDLPADRWDRWFFDHALVGLSMGIGVLCGVLGWRLGLVAAAFHTVAYLLLNAAINAIGHTAGRQTHQNTSFNNQWLALITAGEGLHNNHHAAPTSARLSLARGEIDWGWWVIRSLQRLGWATVRHSETKPKREAAAA